MFNKLIFKIFSLLLVLVSVGFGQTDLEKNIQQILNPASSMSSEYMKNYLKGYMQPFVTAFGTAVCGAMYHRATVKEFPKFDAGISAVYINFPAESKNFKDSQNNVVPTLFGSTNNPLNMTNLPGGIGANSILVPQLQINLGLVSSFEISARYMDFEIKEIGDINMVGFGVKYGFGEFMPIFPIDLSVQAMYHKFSISDWLDSGTIGMNLHLSKELLSLPIEFYGGVGFEATTMLLKTGLLPVENVLNIGEVSINGENNYRYNLGLSWTLAFFNLYADYNFGKYKSLSFGAMVVL